jgi:hypothetical protein
MIPMADFTEKEFGKTRVYRLGHAVAVEQLIKQFPRSRVHLSGAEVRDVIGAVTRAPSADGKRAVRRSKNGYFC